MHNSPRNVEAIKHVILDKLDHICCFEFYEGTILAYLEKQLVIVSSLYDGGVMDPIMSIPHITKDQVAAVKISTLIPDV